MKPTTPSQRRRAIFRRQLIMPVEHGSWSWLLVPFGVGAGIAGQFNLPMWLTLTAGLSLFLMRQPATLWLRVKQRRARRSDGPIAAMWATGFGLLGFLCVMALMALGRSAILWLAGPLAGILILYLAAARYGRVSLRSLGMELAGAGALAMMAPAALVAADGRFGGLAWALWAIMAVQNTLGALYVRLRIHDTRSKPISRSMILWGHVAGLAIVALVGATGIVAWSVTLPFVGFLIRAVWAVRRVRPVQNVKRFGFAEMGIEILSGAWIVVAHSIL